MRRLLLIVFLVCMIFVPGRAAVNEWVLGEPTYAQDDYEWVLGGPFVEVDNTAAPAAGAAQIIFIQID